MLKKVNCFNFTVNCSLLYIQMIANFVLIFILLWFADSYIKYIECSKLNVDNYMNMGVIKVKAFVLRVLVVLLAWIISGCGAKSAKLPTYMRPESLYLCREPYSCLYVEVDSVEGVEVPQDVLSNLKEFLNTFCSKPDGIEIVRDKPIPISEVADLPLGPASILCIDGPPEDEKPQPAYLHVFFYDTDIVFKKVKMNTFVPSNCPCTIFFDVDYAPRWAGFCIRHEAGHTLGLCKSTSHGNGVHCKNSGCLMNWTPDLLSQLGSLVAKPSVGSLCDDCRSDLQVYKSEKPDPNLSFNGPFLMRRQVGYSVASLPYCDFLVWPSIEKTFDWRQALEKIKDSIKSEGFRQKRFGWMFGTFSPDGDETSPQSMIETLGVFTNAADDPNPAVRRYAIQQLEQLRQNQSE